MSTDWNLWCRQCNEETRYADRNHAEEAFAEVLLLRPQLESLGLALVAFPKASDAIERAIGADTWNFVRLLNFMAEHVGHEIFVRSEYGAIHGRCSWYGRQAPGDGYLSHCNLVAGHAGPHSHGLE